MHVCKGYFSISAKRNGLLYPFFHSENANIPFVQIVDEEYKISAFSPFFDLDQYQLVPSSLFRAYDVGDHCALAYFDNDGSLIEADIHELRIRFSDMLAEDFEALPILTKLQIARVTQRKLLDQRQLWVQFSNEFLKTTLAKDVYVSGLMKTLMSEKKIWKSIRESVKPPQTIFDPADFFRGWDRNDLWMWLVKGDDPPKWPYGWLRLSEICAIDAEIFTLGSRWIMRSLRGPSNRTAIYVLSVLLDYKQFIDDERDFFEFLVDMYIDGSIYNLIPYISEEKILKTIRYFIDKDSINVDGVSIMIDAICSYRVSAFLTAEFLKDLCFGKRYQVSQISRDQKVKLYNFLRASSHIASISHVGELGEVLKDAVPLLRSDPRSV